MANHRQGQFPRQNIGANGWRGTSPLSLFPPNGYGLNDVTGNVWEWTRDPYTTSNSGSQTTPSPCCQALTDLRVATRDGRRDDGQTAVGIPQHVVKGGSHLLRYRPAAREPESLDTPTSHIGFRCVIRGER
jgi:formylglycine-generating enzyme required for sulfatase activity